MVVIRSNIWPGALSFASQREQDSVYIGWGVKYSSETYIPPMPLTVENEYDFNGATTNNDDNTVVVKKVLNSVIHINYSKTSYSREEKS